MSAFLIILVPLAILAALSLLPRRSSSLRDRAARDVAEAARETEQGAELWRRLGARTETEAKAGKVVPIREDRRQA